jgi:hypothetical protein
MESRRVRLMALLFFVQNTDNYFSDIISQMLRRVEVIA